MELREYVEGVPAGSWAVGVSGGADSVGLLSLLRRRDDLQLHVAHFDHQLRGEESREDARFVQRLAVEIGVGWTVGRRDELERDVENLPENASSRYRILRLQFFRQVVAAQKLQGVILAHHADDQAETVLHRLLRGSGVEGLWPMAPRAVLAGLVVFRPLLRVRREALRQHLVSIGQKWREDSSNATHVYERNRLRSFIAERPGLTERLLAIAEASRSLREWTARHSPRLASRFAVDELAGLPAILARKSAGRWLISVGVPPGRVTSSAINRLVRMAGDAASPARSDFPGGVKVRRRRGEIFAGSPERSDCIPDAGFTRS